MCRYEYSHIYQLVIRSFFPYSIIIGERKKEVFTFSHTEDRTNKKMPPFQHLRTSTFNESIRIFKRSVLFDNKQAIHNMDVSLFRGLLDELQLTYIVTSKRGEK